jgi:ATP phosphoribosyltransferase regulatory subunit
LEEAARQLWLVTRLRDVFMRWGYAPIIPPTVAYAENVSAELAPHTYRFFDREGHTLALRADLTLPVARIVGTRLFDQPLPLRLSYVERVFRHIAPQAGRRREFTQAGVELVGADTPQADAEIVALAAEALRGIGVRDFRLAVGQMAFFRSLLGELGLHPAQVALLKEAIDRRNDTYLHRVLDDLDLPSSMQTLLRALPTLSGRRDVIAQARTLTPIDAAQQALDRLEVVFDRLEAYQLGDVVLVDLGEVRGMDYYTGLVFRGYALGIGNALCSGGRYNGLIGRFGPDLPAIGFGIDVGLARLVTNPPIDLCPDMVVQSCSHPACHAAVRQMRSRGHRVVVDVLGRDGAELVAYAHSLGAKAGLCQGEGVWQVVERDGNTEHTDTRQNLEGLDT